MGESFWQQPYSNLSLESGYIYAQIFSPLWNHTLNTIRVYLRTSNYPTSYTVSIQYLKPDGTPTGYDLTPISWVDRHEPWGAYTNVRQHPTLPLRLVKGTNYAFVVRAFDFHPRFPPTTRYQLPPGGYPRGNLIVSPDGGTTWDMSDHGDLLFSEFGDPPLTFVPYNPPFDHWAVTAHGSNDYSTASCIRLGSSSPTKATLTIAVEKPTPRQLLKTVRGVSTMCLNNYVFKVSRSYLQLENNDSLYHTFHVTKLKTGQKYWFAMVADANFSATPSVSPIFTKIHPAGPPFTTIKRPDAPGIMCNVRIDGNGLPCPDHYQTINESKPDDEASQLYNLPSVAPWARDLYHIPDLHPFDRPIAQVHTTARIKNIGSRPAAAVAWTLVYTHGTIYQDSRSFDLGPVYENRHWHLYTNPFTALPWTPQEVNDLQIGIQLRNTRGIGWTAKGYCTQLYCKIIHDCSPYE